jgi:hypothetical protein
LEKTGGFKLKEAGGRRQKAGGRRFFSEGDSNPS